MNKGWEVIDFYTHQYPQLTLGVKEGMSESEEYANIVRRGIFPSEYTFPGKVSGDEEQILINTPIGTREVLYLPVRETFEFFINSISNKCEPVPIPPTTGAIMIDGINNWNRIHEHRDKFLIDHDASEWGAEFKKFTLDASNYKDKLLIISKGDYSAVKGEVFGIEESSWLDMSKNIRIYHELTHLISRTLFIENKEAVRDEVIADCIGLLGATGQYDTYIASYVLGVEGNEYRRGGRLENYVEESSLKEMAEYSKRVIQAVKEFLENLKAQGKGNDIGMPDSSEANDSSDTHVSSENGTNKRKASVEKKIYSMENGFKDNPFECLLLIEQAKIGIETH